MNFAVTVTAGDGRWNVRSFRDDFDTPSAAIGALRRLRSETAAFALICVEDEYFVIARLAPGTERVFISDITMAVDDDYATGWAAHAGLEIPAIDPDEIDGWADGDFELLADLGITAETLTVLADDPETWPHDALMAIADDLGFADEFAEAAGY